MQERKQTCSVCCVVQSSCSAVSDTGEMMWTLLHCTSAPAVSDPAVNWTPVSHRNTRSHAISPERSSETSTNFSQHLFLEPLCEQTVKNRTINAKHAFKIKHARWWGHEPILKHLFCLLLLLLKPQTSLQLVSQPKTRPANTIPITYIHTNSLFSSLGCVKTHDF